MYRKIILVAMHIFIASFIGTKLNIDKCEEKVALCMYKYAVKWLKYC